MPKARSALKWWWGIFRSKPLRKQVTEGLRILRQTGRAERQRRKLASLTPAERANILFGEGWEERCALEHERMRAVGDALSRASWSIARSGYTLEEAVALLSANLRAGTLSVADLTRRP